MRWPLDSFVISQGYSSTHEALDLAAPAGAPIKSAVSGTVVAVNNTDPNYIGGLYVIVREAGGAQREFYTGHASAVHVGVGQAVKEGDHVADVGQTGLATGPHVHYQIRQFNGGSLINPADVMEGMGQEDKAMQDEIQKLWNYLDGFNKANDKKFAQTNRRIDSVDQDKQKLWNALDRTNRNNDLVKKALDELSRKTGSPIDLDDYEVQLVKKPTK